MDPEQDYLKYVGEFSLSITAISAAYFFDPNNLATAATLLMIPLLFGYTARISRDRFQTSSFLSLIALMFTILSPIMAALAVLISVGNILISFFAGGSSFTDYYRATTIPLLLTGLLLGGAVYGATIYQPSLSAEIRQNAAGIAANQTSTVLEETQIIEQQRNANQQMVEQTASGTIALTQGYVLNQTKRNLSKQDQQIVLNAFQDAEADIPQRLATEADGKQKALNISDRVKGSMENLLKGNLIILIPLITFLIYGLHPVLGFLTAIFSSLFAFTERKLA